jgi:PAS domain S-box-containing protein
MAETSRGRGHIAPSEPELGHDAAAPHGRLLEVVALAADRLMKCGRVDECLPLLLEPLGAATMADAVTVVRTREDGPHGAVMAPLATWIQPDTIAGRRAHAASRLASSHGLGSWAESLRAGRVVRGPAVGFPPAERDFLRRLSIRSVMAVPVLTDRGWWGTIVLVDHRRDRRWTSEEVVTVQTLAAVMGSKLTEERLAHELTQTERRYRQLVELSPDAILVHRAGVIVFANVAAASLLGGTTSADLVGESLLRFVDQSSRGAVLDQLGRLREGRSVPLTDETLVRLDGSPVAVEVAARPFVFEGEPAVQTVARDITLRRQTEAAIRESEARKSAIVEASLDAIITIDERGVVLEFNASAETMFGRARDRVVGQEMAELLIPPRLRARHRLGLRRHLATGESRVIGRRVEVTGCRADGTEFPAELAITRIEASGRTLFTAHIRDLTERVDAEQAVRDSEDRYRRLVELSPDAMAVYTDGTFVFANSSMARLLGAERAEHIVGRPVVDVMPPESSGPVGWEERAGGTAGASVPFAEERFLRLDRTPIDVEVAGIPLTFEGRPSTQIVVRDVTDRKRAESALRDRNRYLAALHETSLALIGRLNLEDMLKTIVATAGALVGTEHGYVYLVGPEGHLEVRVGVGTFAGWVGHRMVAGEGVAGKVWTSRRPLVVADYDGWDGRSPSFPRGAFHAVIGIPLSVGAEIVGVLGLGHVDPERRFSSEEQEVLSSFANLASVALENARLYTESQERLADRERAEEQLRLAEEKFRTLVEQIPAITYIAEFGPTSPWLYVSPKIEDILGFSPEEWMVRPNLWWVQLHPADRERVMQEEDASRDDGRPRSQEYRLIAKDGRMVWVRDDWVVVPGPEGVTLIQGVMFDITDQKRSHQQLSEAEARYRTLVEQIPAITYVDRVDGSDPYASSYVSPQIEGMLGYTQQEFIETPDLWPRLIHPGDRTRVLENDRRHSITGRPLSQEYRLVARDGRVVWVLDEAVVIRGEQGQALYSHGILYDITERKRAEEDLERALRMEREAGERLRALDELRNTFLHAVSHELRTPLAAVLGFALTLERQEVQLPEADRQEIIRRLAANARKLDQLLSDLLDLDRLDRGIVEPRRRATDVEALVRRTVANSDVLATRVVRVEVGAEVGPVAVDGSKVERIVENLLANAARHTPAASPIWVVVEGRDGGVLIRVEDEGPGVPGHLRETIFRPFEQGPDAPRHSPGVGIGLSLVAKFAELHGGRAWVEDRPGGGASFRVFLPDGPEG